MHNGIFDQNDRKVRRFDAPHINPSMFHQGDLVKYTGAPLAKELGGKIGTICARVGKSQNGVVVDFGEDQAYIIDERNLTRTVAKPKTEEVEVEKKKQPEVQKRKGVGKRQKNADNAE